MSVENKIPQKGVVSEEGAVTNMTVLCHEYRGGCIFRGGGWG